MKEDLVPPPPLYPLRVIRVLRPIVREACTDFFSFQDCEKHFVFRRPCARARIEGIARAGVFWSSLGAVRMALSPSEAFFRLSWRR